MLQFSQRRSARTNEKARRDYIALEGDGLFWGADTVAAAAIQRLTFARSG